MYRPPFLRVSRTAIECYHGRILGGEFPITDQAVVEAVEAEIFAMLARCSFPQFPRYVVRIDGVRFVIVGGVVVTALARGSLPWIGIHRPGYKIEVEVNAG